eukprot:1186641-Prorocentrum_minimum.AAC.9
MCGECDVALAAYVLVSRRSDLLRSRRIIIGRTEQPDGAGGREDSLLDSLLWRAIGPPSGRRRVEWLAACEGARDGSGRISSSGMSQKLNSPDGDKRSTTHKLLTRFACDGDTLMCVFVHQRASAQTVVPTAKVYGLQEGGRSA